MSKKCSIEKCSAWATPDGDCFAHSISLAEKRALARAKGGRVGKLPKDRTTALVEPITVSNPSDVTNLLTETINNVRAGLIDVKLANCVGYLSNFLLKSLELSSLENRLESIERIVLERRTKV